jgi:GT2 family glycosyltransferase
LAFVAVYIKRSTFDRIGLFDERFSSSLPLIAYGCEDSDFVYRVELAGLKFAVTPRVLVKHGIDGRTASSSSFLRQMTRKQQIDSMLAMRRVLSAKWGGKCI